MTAPWIKLGDAASVAGHGDYLTGRAPDAAGAAIPVVVQNFQGALKAFRNVCSHRYALIHDQPCGRGLLRCPYHGWVYDAAGVPIGIPFDDSDFHLDAEARRRLALAPVGLAVANGQVWVNADAAAIFTEPA
ncbi:Rieske 2Fe-2S domain-containing protein [Nitrospirillum amazonense]|uniref:Rieske 2Fe-2S domain-containing protein n=1 Tax=Nitrospirillum amazonense TaxID=28077 RepID=UPI0024126AA3|nr:Rieske 2Fe-2S domain-containing protein [Nitrospirillum amazonense]MDG3443022.1 Rieske 2Fe-2S domain-containing protein [Nitrospirillum amazonense]